MNLFASIAAAGVSLLLLFAIFRPLELSFPAKVGQKTFRPGWFTDFCHFAGTYLFWTGIVTYLLALFWNQINWPPLDHFRSQTARQPFWLQAVEVILLSDLLIYWGHRLQHRIPLLWRFHSVHHSAEHLDWLAAHREHPLDTLYTVGLINLPMFVFGFPLESIAWLIAFRGIWAIYIHSNVRLPIGPLRWIIGAPELHHWHHDLNRHAGNYANLSPLMDLIFGTYNCPKQEPEAFGINEPISQNYAGQMLHPFKSRKPKP